MGRYYHETDAENWHLSISGIHQSMSAGLRKGDLQFLDGSEINGEKVDRG